MTSSVPDIHELKPEAETENIVSNEESFELKRPFKHICQIFDMYDEVVEESMVRDLSEIAILLGGELKAVESQLQSRYNQSDKDLDYFTKVGQTTKCMKTCLVKKKPKDFVALWKSAKDATVISLLFRRLKRQAGLVKRFNIGAGDDTTDEPKESSTQEKVIGLVEKGSEVYKRADEFGLTNVAEHILEGALGLGDELPYVKTALGIISSIYGIFKANATLRAEAMDLLRMIRNVEVILGGTLISENEEQAFLLDKLVEVLEMAEFYIIQCLIPDQNVIAKVLKATARVENIDQLKEEIVKQLNQAMFAETAQQSDLLKKLDEKANHLLEMKASLDNIADSQQQQVHELIKIKKNVEQLAEGLAPSKYKPASKNFLEVDGYRLAVEGGRHFKTAEGEYVELGSGYNYRLLLRNGTQYKCRAEVRIDDVLIGMFALESKEEYFIERPVALARRFMFYSTSKGSKVEDSGIEKKRRENGLLECAFIPELVYTIKARHQNYAGVLSEPLIFDLNPEQGSKDLIRQVIRLVPGSEKDTEAYVINFADQYIQYDLMVSALYADWKKSNADEILVIEIAREVRVINPKGPDETTIDTFTCSYASDVEREVILRYGVPSSEDVKISEELSDKREKFCYTAHLLKGLIEVADPPREIMKMVIFKSMVIEREVQRELNLESDSIVKVLRKRTPLGGNFDYVAQVVIEKDISIRVISFDGRQDTVTVKSSITLLDLKEELVWRTLMEEDSNALTHSHPQRGVDETDLMVDYGYSDTYIAFERFSDGSEVTVKPTIFSYKVQLDIPGCPDVLSTNIAAYKTVADLRVQVLMDLKTKTSCDIEDTFVLVDLGMTEILQNSQRLRDLGNDRNLAVLPKQMELSVVDYETTEKLGSIKVSTQETILSEVAKKVHSLLQEMDQKASGSAKTDTPHLCLLFKAGNKTTCIFNTLTADDMTDVNSKIPLQFLTSCSSAITVITSKPISLTLHIEMYATRKTWRKDVETETCATLFLALKKAMADSRETDEEFARIEAERFCVSGSDRLLQDQRECITMLGIKPGSTVNLTDVLTVRSLALDSKLGDKDLSGAEDLSRGGWPHPMDRSLATEGQRDDDHLPVIPLKEEVHTIREFKISAGATTLQGHSDQAFEQVDVFTLDFSKKVVLNLRMVARKGDHNPLPIEEEPAPLETARFQGTNMVRPVDGSTARNDVPPPVPDDDDDDDE